LNNAIRLITNPATQPYSSADDRELDGQITAIKPGDHIVFKAQLMATPSTLGDTTNWHGMRIGIDMYGGFSAPDGRINEIDTPDGLSGYEYPNLDFSLLAVPWGTTTWTNVTMDFIVPSTYLSDPYTPYGAGHQIVPAAFIPFIVGWDNTWWGGGGGPQEGAIGYIANTELYINP